MNASLRRFPIIILFLIETPEYFTTYFFTRNEIFKFVLFINYRRTWSARLLVSGNATSKIAVSLSPEVLGPTQPLLQPQSDQPSEDWEKWRTCKKCSLFLFSACVSTKKRVNNKSLVFNQLFFQSKFQMCHYTPTPLVWCLLFCASSSVHNDWPVYSRQGRLSYHNLDQMMWSLWPPYDLLDRVLVSRVEVWIEPLHCLLDMRLFLWN